MSRFRILGNARAIAGPSRLRAVLLSVSLSTVSLSAAITGAVTNGTTGKPQGGATVTLYRVGGNGPESLESVKAAKDGTFTITAEVQGPRLLQAAWAGVTYNRMLPPGAPSSNVGIEVFESAPRVAEALVSQHMMLLEPVDGKLGVSESFVYENRGKLALNNPKQGSLQFYLPPEANGEVTVNCLAPQGMPIRRPADKAGPPNIYKVDFPIKPGQSRIDLTYSMPFNSPGEFLGKVLYKGGPTRVIVPAGVNLEGKGVQALGQEPTTKAGIFGVPSPEFRVQVTGMGRLRQAGNGAGGDASAEADTSGAPGISVILPALYGKVSPVGGLWAAFNGSKWIFLIALAILALGFTLLYRKGAPGRADSAQNTLDLAKVTDERRKR